MNKCSRWFSIASQHFPKITNKRIVSVITNILAVDLQIKPSYLWDAFTTVPTSVDSFIKDLKNHGLIKKDISVVSLSDDILVLTSSVCAIHFQQYKHVIDISERLNAPELASKDVLKQVMKHKLQLMTELNNTSTGVININSEWNISTLFGAVINYPALYWYEKDCNNCLSMVPLRVYKVNAKLPPLCSQEQTLYSFSIPDNFSKELNATVQDWYLNIVNIFQMQNVFTDLHLKESVRTLHSVVL